MRDFDEIYSEYFSEVYKFTLGLCRDAPLAEEITQQTFFNALKSIGSFRGECGIGTWLCKIAKNTFYSYAKKHKGQAEYPIELIISRQDVGERLEDKETAYMIHEALHKLKEPYREVFWLRAFGELPFSQIASLFDKTESWARVTYYRAKILIREELQ